MCKRAAPTCVKAGKRRKIAAKDAVVAAAENVVVEAASVEQVVVVEAAGVEQLSEEPDPEKALGGEATSTYTTSTTTPLS